MRAWRPVLLGGLVGGLVLGPLLGALLGLAGGSAQAATLRVRAGEDLQAALDAAAPGDDGGGG